MADATGPAQVKDKNVEAAGRARRALAYVKERVPLSSWKKDRLAREGDDKVRREERARIETRKELEGAADQRAAPNIDVRTGLGEGHSPFTKSLLDAIRRGQSRTQTDTPDMMIRAVVCHPNFIDAIAQGSIKTPLEDVDTEYSAEMSRRRKSLADQLRLASRHSDYNLGSVTAHEMDLIYVTMLGNVNMWAGAQWPDELPKPPEAIFKFLESVAVRERPGREGEFIGNVLKDLSSRRTITDSTERTLKPLIDSAYVDNYLYNKSAEPIDRAVASFKNLVGSLLETPSNQIHPELGVPGIGYTQEYQRKLNGVTQKLNDVKTDYDAAVEACTAAQAAYDQIQGVKTKVGGKWERIPDEGKRKQAAKAEADAQGELDEAKQKVLGLRGVLERLAREASKFESEHCPEAITQELVDHFRAVIVSGKEMNADLKSIGEEMKGRLVHPEITSLLDEAARLAAERDEFAPVLIGTQVADANSEGPKEISFTNIARDMIGYRVEEFRRKMERFESSIEDARLHESTKEPIRGIARGLKHFGVPRVFLDEQIGKVRETNAFPIRKAAHLAVDKLAKKEFENMVGITDAQRLTARMVWEAASSDLDSPQGKREGRWQKFKQWVGYHFFTVESWKNKGKWLYGLTISSDIQDIRNFRQKVKGKRPSGEPYQTRMWRGPVGLAKLALKSYVAGGVLAGLVLSSGQVSWYKPWSWPAPIVRRAGGPFSISESHWYAPWTWVMPVRSPQTIRVIHDHYDIPDLLPERGNDYYRSAYGLGSDFSGQQTTAAQRLEWLQRHPDVLRFFQERRSMREVVSWERLRHNETNPDQCSSSQRRIPQTCDDLLMPEILRNQVSAPSSVDRTRLVARAIQSYPAALVENPNDGWREDVPSMRVCCEVRITARAVRDGLMLNRTQSDRFVDELIALERGGTTVNYAYISNPDNRIRWANNWYLITQTENSIMEDFRVRDRANVQFILAQGSPVSNKLLPRCGERGEEREFIQQAHRDELVRMWVEEIRRAYANHDPMAEIIPDATVASTFQTVMDQARTRGWVDDTTVEYERRQVRRELELLDLQTDTSVDALVLDWRTTQQQGSGASTANNLFLFLRQFSSTGAIFRLGDQRSDEFVQMLVQHRQRGGSLADYDPFTSPQGSRVQWASNMGLIRSAEQFTPTGGDAGATAPAQSSAQQVQPPAPIPDLSPQAERFYAAPANEGFKNFVEAVMLGLYQDTRGDGRIMQDVLGRRFGGNRDRMDRAIKAEVYRLLSSAEPIDVQARAGYHLSVSGSADSLHVEDIQPQQARGVSTSLRNHILQFVRRQGAAR
ncbi:MAG: hypothetical protein U0R44_02855 [Candidatus Micrarchaeia archaeon]